MTEPEIPRARTGPTPGELANKRALEALQPPQKGHFSSKDLLPDWFRDIDPDSPVFTEAVKLLTGWLTQEVWREYQQMKAEIAAAEVVPPQPDSVRATMSVEVGITEHEYKLRQIQAELEGNHLKSPSARLVTINDILDGGYPDTPSDRDAEILELQAYYEAKSDRVLAVLTEYDGVYITTDNLIRKVREALEDPEPEQPPLAPKIYEPFTFGDLIAELSEKGDDLVYGFDGNIQSYRGYYDRPSLDPFNKAYKASDLVNTLTIQVGTTRTGYKGGEFSMSLDKLIHYASWGESGPNIIGLEQHPSGTWQLILCAEKW